MTHSIAILLALGIAIDARRVQTGKDDYSNDELATEGPNGNLLKMLMFAHSPALSAQRVGSKIGRTPPTNMKEATKKALDSELDSSLKKLNDLESLQLLASINCYPIIDPKILSTMTGQKMTEKAYNVLKLFHGLQSEKEKFGAYSHIMKHVGDMNVRALGADIKKQWEESDIKEPAAAPDGEKLGEFVLALTKALEKDNGLSDGQLSGPSNGLDELPAGREFKKVFEQASKKSPAITSITEQTLSSQVPNSEGADVRAIRFQSLATALGQAIVSMRPAPTKVELKKTKVDPNDFEAPPAEVLEIEIGEEYANAMSKAR